MTHVHTCVGKSKRVWDISVPKTSSGCHTGFSPAATRGKVYACLMQLDPCNMLFIYVVYIHKCINMLLRINEFKVIRVFCCSSFGKANHSNTHNNGTGRRATKGCNAITHIQVDAHNAIDRTTLLSWPQYKYISRTN
jgi:hypothetical protein